MNRDSVCSDRVEVFRSVTADLRSLDRARTSRDARFDGKFFIAVTSTGIYCRPICPVRSPKREHIRYFATAAAAGAAGFRPCLRCRPEAAPGTPAWLGTCAIVRRALRLIDAGALDRGTVEQLAALVGIGARHLQRLFVQHVGASPIAVAQTKRLHFAKRLLDETALPFTKIAGAAGFGSVRRFNSAFRSTYGRAPRDLRRKRPPARTAGRAGELVLRLSYRPPYDWSEVCEFLARRVIPGVERVDAHGYARTVASADGPLIVSVRRVAGEHALELRVQGAPSCDLLQLSSNARRMFDLSADPASIARAFRSDAILAPLVARRPGLRIAGAWSPFECAVRAVVGQQISVAAGRTIAARLVARAGQSIVSGTPGLTHLFPSPSALAEADLRGLGLTRERANALNALARAVADGELDFNDAADEVTKRLGALTGIGAWTSQYVALRGLGEPDAFPSGDLVLRKMAADGSTILSERSLEVRAKAWRPWRGYAVMHLWRAAVFAGACIEPRDVRRR